VMFVLDLGVSFFLSVCSAVHAYHLPREEAREMLRRLGRHFVQSRLDFILPLSSAPAGGNSGPDPSVTV